MTPQRFQNLKPKFEKEVYIPTRIKKRIIKNEFILSAKLLQGSIDEYLSSKYQQAYWLARIYIKLTRLLYEYYSTKFFDSDIVFLGRDAWPIYILWRMLGYADESKGKAVLLHISRYMMTSKDPLGRKVYTGILKHLYDKGLTDDEIKLTVNPFYVKVPERFSAFGTYCRMTGLGTRKILVFDTGYRGTVSLFAKNILQKTLDVHVDNVMFYSMIDYIPSLLIGVEPNIFDDNPKLKTLFEAKDFDDLINMLESWPHPINPVKGYRYDDVGDVRLRFAQVNEENPSIALLYYHAMVEAVKDFNDSQ